MRLPATSASEFQAYLWPREEEEEEEGYNRDPWGRLAPLLKGVQRE